jgi:hypothetical protein
MMVHPSTGTGGNSFSCHGTTESFLARSTGLYVVLGSVICFGSGSYLAEESVGAGSYLVAWSVVVGSYFVAWRVVFVDSYLVAGRRGAVLAMSPSYFVEGRRRVSALLVPYLVAGSVCFLRDDCEDVLFREDFGDIFWTDHCEEKSASIAVMVSRDVGTLCLVDGKVSARARPYVVAGRSTSFADCGTFFTTTLFEGLLLPADEWLGTVYRKT